jgi:hypothetical protein
MAQERPNRLVEWLLLLREQWPVARRKFEEWLAQVREEPVLFWETTAVRYVIYGLAAIVLSAVALKARSWIVPPSSVSAVKRATTADYHVICTNASCGHHFVIHEKFGFHGFPVECPKCRQKTGEQARKCTSKTCQSRWVAPLEKNGASICPHCGTGFEWSLPRRNN